MGDTTVLDELRRMHAVMRDSLAWPGVDVGEARSVKGAIAAYLDPNRKGKAPSGEKVEVLRDRYNALVAARDARPHPAPQVAQVTPCRGEEPSDSRATGGALAAFLAGLADLPDGTPVIALAGGLKPTGLSLGDLRRLA